MTDAEDELLRWAKAEYRKRTRLLKEGYGRVQWVDPGTRVSWSEVVNKAQQLGIKRGVTDLRLWYIANK